MPSIALAGLLLLGASCVAPRPAAAQQFQQHAGGRAPTDAELAATWVHEDAQGRAVYRFTADHRLTVTVPGMETETHPFHRTGKRVTVDQNGHQGELEVGLIDAGTLEIVLGGRAFRMTRQR